MKEVSIEYAHIYTNSKIGDEHKLSLELLSELDTTNSSLVVLVDDYSFPDPTFSYDTFVNWLAENGHKPNVVMRESQLVPLCDQVLNMMELGDLQTELTDYIKTKKYPCSLFIAAWYFLRLGVLKHQSFPESESANHLINILPESLKTFEDKGFEIIKKTPHANLVEKIEDRFFKGRMIA